MKQKDSKFRDWVYSEGGPYKLAEKLGIGQPAVQHWLSRRNSPSLALAIKMARMGKGKITVQDILNGTKPE